nr:MAG TPA: hypothetical protein [Bacteriophage sp.]
MLAAAAVAATTSSIAIRCSVGTASDIAGNGEGTHRIDDGLRLRETAQLELSCLQVVTQLLDGVLSHQSTGGIAVSLDGIDNVAGVACVLIAHRINVPVGFAAALLSGKTALSDVVVHPIEALAQLVLNTVHALQHGGVHSIEAIAETVLNIADAVFQTLSVQTVIELSTGQSTLSRCVVAKAKAAATPGKQEEQEEHPDPGATAPSKHAIVVSVLKSQSISHRQTATRFHTHIVVLLVIDLFQPRELGLKLSPSIIKIDAPLFTEVFTGLLQFFRGFPLSHLLSLSEHRVCVQLIHHEVHRVQTSATIHKYTHHLHRVEVHPLLPPLPVPPLLTGSLCSSPLNLWWISASFWSRSDLFTYSLISWPLTTAEVAFWPFPGWAPDSRVYFRKMMFPSNPSCFV